MHSRYDPLMSEQTGRNVTVRREHPVIAARVSRTARIREPANREIHLAHVNDHQHRITVPPNVCSIALCEEREDSPRLLRCARRQLRGAIAVYSVVAARYLT